MIRKATWIGLSLWLVAASAAVYRWDLGGQSYFSDRPVPSATIGALRPGFIYHRVRYVYDGDTVQLADGRRVRLLNINTPEIGTERKRGEPGGEQARRALQALTGKRRIRLESDLERYDKYGRTLAYLFTEDGIHVNLTLVQQGWAIANVHPPNLKYADAILAAQREAEREKRGIWGMDAYAPKPIEILRRKKLYGWQRLVGKVNRIESKRKFIRLEFAQDLYALIPKSNLKWFPKLDAYLKARVEVRGWPARRGREHSILIRHPSALLVLGSGLS